MAKNRRQILKTQRKKKSVLRHVDHQNETIKNETETISDTVVSSDTGESKKDSPTPNLPALRKVLKDAVSPSATKSATPNLPALVTPGSSTESPAEQVASGVEKKNAPSPSGPAKNTGSKLGNLQKNLRSMVKDKLEDSALGQIVDAVKGFREEAHDMLLSDDERADKEFAEKLKADKREALEKAKEQKLQWDALDRSFAAGKINEDEFKKYSKDLFSSQKIEQSGDIAADIHAMREALENQLKRTSAEVERTKPQPLTATPDVVPFSGINEQAITDALTSALDSVKQKQAGMPSPEANPASAEEVASEAAVHEKAVETEDKNQHKEVIRALAKIDEHTVANKPDATFSDDSKSDSFKDTLKKKAINKVKDLAKKIPGAGKIAEAGKSVIGKTPIPAGTGLSTVAGEAGALTTGAEAAAGGAGLLSTLGAGIGTLGAGTVALGATAAGALGYGAGSLLYNNSETVRDGAGSVMEGIFGHIKTPDEMEQERQANMTPAQRERQLNAAVKRQRAQVEPALAPQVTVPDKLPTAPMQNDTVAAIDAQPSTVESIPRTKNIADATDAQIKEISAKVIENMRKAQQDKWEAYKAKAGEQNSQTSIVVQGGNSSQANSTPAPRSQENTLQRLSERMFRGSQV